MRTISIFVCGLIFFLNIWGLQALNPLDEVGSIEKVRGQELLTELSVDSCIEDSAFDQCAWSILSLVFEGASLGLYRTISLRYI